MDQDLEEYETQLRLLAELSAALRQTEQDLAALIREIRQEQAKGDMG